ncbi:hypothetical protein HP567_011515 [Brevibacillus sp. M2.1A]|uniref:hypothetical protein n=1 Tax=Brevibacillus TaxID=55080 RepID=UPI00156B9D0A|nr:MULTISPECIES: hypothetical protein [Brevibacillus]MBY0085918.1 hypothetical protein [Brevibacillus brevis]MCC8435172.1 hypothetical protein [Brevibacillus sp. M2.1A]MCE0452272.1 hypothetical protein [Brevibacillus sp. AF8]
MISLISFFSLYLLFSKSYDSSEASATPVLSASPIHAYSFSQKTLHRFENLGLTRQDEVLTLTYVPEEHIALGAYLTLDSNSSGDFIGGYEETSTISLKNGTAKFGYNGPLATLIWKNGATHYELTYHFYYEEDVIARLVEIANTYKETNLP